MPKAKASKLQALLEKHGACHDGREWALGFKTPSAAWQACTNPEWLLWALDELGLLDDKRARLFACWCVRNTPLADGRKTWDLLTDECSRKVVEITERFADGEATLDELNAAWASARASARDAARDAARASAWASAWDAAWASAWASARASAWDAARASAWDAARDAQCKQLRKMFPNPFKKGV